MSNSIVRLALDGSVACTVAAGQVPQHPGVDGAEGQVGAGVDAALGAAATRAWWPRSRGRAPARSAPAPGRGGRPPASSSQRAAVRRSCQTMARCRGRPVRRSQTTTVSRWLVMPRAATGCSRQPAEHLGQVARDRRPDLVGVVLDPARAGEVLGELPVGACRPAVRPRRPRRPGRPSSPRRWRRRRPWRRNRVRGHHRTLAQPPVEGAGTEGAGARVQPRGGSISGARPSTHGRTGVRTNSSPPERPVVDNRAIHRVATLSLHRAASLPWVGGRRHHFANFASGP